jgi:hypothetical protein
MARVRSDDACTHAAAPFGKSARRCAQLAAHYKNHGQFVSQWGQAAQDEVKAGFLLPPDALELKDAAAQSQIGK